MAATQEEIIAGLAEIIEEVTGIEPSEVTPEKSFVDDLDIDSLSMVEIAVQTEDKYGVKIPDEDLAGLRTVGDVVSYIQKLEEENPEAAAALREKIAADAVTRPSTANGGFPSVVVTAVTATTSIARGHREHVEGLVGRRERHPRPRGRVRHQVGPARAHRWPPQGARRRPHGPAGPAAHVVCPADGQVRSVARSGRPRARPRSTRTASRSSIGTGLGGGEKIVETYDLMNEGGPRKVSPLAVQMIMPNGAAAVIGLRTRCPRRRHHPGVGLFVGLGGHRARVAADRHG